MQALFLLWEGVEIDFDRLLAKKKLKKIVTTNSNNNKIVKKNWSEKYINRKYCADGYRYIRLPWLLQFCVNNQLILYAMKRCFLVIKD